MSLLPLASPPAYRTCGIARFNSLHRYRMLNCGIGSFFTVKLSYKGWPGPVYKTDRTNGELDRSHDAKLMLGRLDELTDRVMVFVCTASLSFACVIFLVGSLLVNL